MQTIAPNLTQMLSAKGLMVQRSLEADDHTVEGFISVYSVDRHNEIVNPNEFNVDAFMANPQLMLNHDYWIDDNGNKQTIGKVLFATPAVVKEIGDKDNWGIFGPNDTQIATFPKDRVPDLVENTKGLWGKVQVSVPEVWEKVEKGELNAFSWRGFSKKDSINGVTAWKNIDLFEVSIVNIPGNRLSLFNVSKSFETKTVESLSLSKEMFDTHSTVLDWVEQYNFGSYHLLDRESDWILTQKSLDAVNKIEQLNANIGIETPNSEKLMSDVADPTKTVETPAVTETVQTEQPKQEVAKEFNVGGFVEAFATKFSEVFTGKFSEVVTKKLEDAFTNLHSKFEQGVNEIVAKSVVKPAETQVTQTETKVEEKTADVVKDSLSEEVKKTLEDQKKMIEDLVAAFKGQTPAESERDEEVRRSLQKDPNSIFNNLFSR